MLGRVLVLALAEINSFQWEKGAEQPTSLDAPDGIAKAVVVKAYPHKGGHLMIAVFQGSLSTAMSTATSTHPVRQVWEPSSDA